MFQKFKDNIGTYFSNGSSKMVFIAVLIFVCSIIGLLSMEKSVNIVIDGKEMSVMTYRSNISDILEKNHIVIGPKDIVEPDLNSKVKSGETIKIKKAVNVKLLIDGKTKNVLTNARNIQDMLKEEGIKLNKEDKVLPSKDKHVEKGLEVAVTRVKTQTEKKVEPIQFATEIKKDNNLKEGRKKVIQEGTTGQKETRIKIVSENGKEVSREVVKEEVTKQPTKRIIAMGTAREVRLSRGGSVNYSKKFRMRATAYTESYKDTGKRPGDKGFGITASGTRVSRNAGGYSTVAVDPRIIPLGTKLYIEGYGYAVAADTGGAIKGNRIDLYFNSDSQVSSWGVRYVNVFIVN